MKGHTKMVMKATVMYLALKAIAQKRGGDPAKFAQVILTLVEELSGGD